jgi:hypothetical protein
MSETVTTRAPVRALSAALACASGALLLLAAGAPDRAEGAYLRGFGEPEFENDSASERTFWFDQAARAGANLTRINLTWRSVVAGGAPAAPSNPNDPGYTFARTDRAVIDAAQRGHRIVMTVFNAPEYAEGPGQPADAADGTWKIDPAALGQFAQALAVRYSGSFVPLGGISPLPRVAFYEPWNEPNLSQYLTPQYREGSNKQLSGDHYRAMVNAFYAGVKRAGSQAQVIAGATAPFGDPPGNTRTRPLRFLREVFCLNGKLKGTKCGDKAQFDLVSHHPITLGHGPGYSAINDDDASMADFDQVIKTVRAAERANTVGGPKRHAAWATEFWWETKPPDQGNLAISISQHRRYIAESLYTLWKQGAEAAVYLRLRDDASQADNVGGEQSGLFFHDKTEKASFQGFRFPFVADRTSKKKVNVWTIAPASGRVEIQAKRGGDFKTVDRLKLSAGSPKQAKLKLSGKATLRAVLGGEASVTSEVK